MLGRSNWSTPIPWGPDGWAYKSLDGAASVIVTLGLHDGDEWLHASFARPDSMPTYDDLKALHAAVFGDGWAYQVFAPPSDHVNIHSFALHLFGRFDGNPALPDFTEGTGSI
jgi:hypothetical protein